MDNKIKHLEFIQSIITRMNTNSFLIKGWVVTLMAAVLAVSTTKDTEIIPFLNYLILPVFWLLDAYYLSQERKYRSLYNDVREKTETQIDFNLDASSYKEQRNCWASSIFSSVLIIFYLSLATMSIVVLYLMNNG